MSARQPERPFRLGDWRVEPASGRLTRILEGSGTDKDGDAPARLTLRPKVMELLVYLASRAGEVVSNDDLITHVWKDVHVTDASLYYTVNQLRAALGDDKEEPRYIRTLARRGYRLLVEPQPLAEDKAAEAAPHHFGMPRLRIALGAFAVLAVTGLLLVTLFYPSGRLPDEEAGPSASIAVLPFADFSPEGDQEYFADGITEELLNKLAGIEGLRVTARTSSFYFKNREASVREIGETLGVAHIVDGSVRKAGDQVRVSAQLVDAKNGNQLWAQSYDGPIGDIFSVQNDISISIARALRQQLALASADLSAPEMARQVDPQAYSEFLLGKYLVDKRTLGSIEAAIEHFRNAIEADDSFAPAHAELAIAYGLLQWQDKLSVEEAYDLAKAPAERAMELDPDLAESNAAKVMVDHLKNIHDPDFKDLNKAIASNPSYMNARNWKMYHLSHYGRDREAFEVAKSGEMIDPLSIIHNGNLMGVLLFFGHYEEALAVAERVKSVDRGWGLSDEAEVVESTGDLIRATEIRLSAFDEALKNPAQLLDMAWTLASVGLYDEARHLLQTPKFSYFLARTAGRWQAAVDLAERELRRGRNLAEFRLAQGEVQYFMRNYDDSIANYAQVLQTDSSPPYRQQNFGWRSFLFYAAALREVGNEAAANSIFAKTYRIIQTQEADGADSGPFHQERGLYLLYQGKAEDALDAFQKAFDAGYREDWEFAAPLFDPLRQHTRFLQLMDQYEAEKVKNRAGILALICADDLADSGWRPLPETCAELTRADAQ